MSREVVFAPEALADLCKLFDDIALDAGTGRAQSYTDRIVAHSLSLDLFPERGTRRDGLRSGLRTTTYRRRVTIAFHITDITVVIDRILYGGRDLNAIFEEDDDD